MKNLAAKTVGGPNVYRMPVNELAHVAYQVWRSLDGSWTWYVLKMWQADDAKPYARWFCRVISPFADELGDVYVSEVKLLAVKIANRMPELVGKSC